MNKAVFLDKDGTLIPDIPFNVDPGKITLETGAIAALKSLKSNGFRLIIISNQSGVAHGYFEESALGSVREKLESLLTSEIPLDSFYYCPHHPEGVVQQYAKDCHCRKPMPGLFFQAAEDHDIDLTRSWMIGDILNDVEAGNRAGCKTILINNGNETEWLLNEMRQPTAIANNLSEAAQLILQSINQQS